MFNVFFLFIFIASLSSSNEQESSPSSKNNKNYLNKVKKCEKRLGKVKVLSDIVPLGKLKSVISVLNEEMNSDQIKKSKMKEPCEGCYKSTSVELNIVPVENKMNSCDKKYVKTHYFKKEIQLEKQECSSQDINNNHKQLTQYAESILSNSNSNPNSRSDARSDSEFRI